MSATHVQRPTVKTPPPPGIFFTPNYYFLNVGNSIKREENMKYWGKKLKFNFFQYCVVLDPTPMSATHVLVQRPTVKTPPPPPEFFFTPNYYFLNVGNSIKREENMKYWKTKIKI